MTGYDQRDQNVNTQFNINIQGSQALDPNTLLVQGIKLLEAKSYQQSINLLSTAIKADPLLVIAYYYLALALLKGKRPKVLNRSQIEEIDQLLSTATALGDFDGTIQWFRALIRHDYYVGNRLNCPSPSVQQIISSIDSGTTDINRLKMLLVQLLFMSDNQLYIELSKLIF